MAQKQKQDLISEEYRVRQFEEAFARHLKPILWDLGAWRAKDGDIQTNRWTRSNHLIALNPHKDHRRRNEICFSGHHYDPAQSELVYGKTAVLQTNEEEVDGFAKTFDNRAGTQPTEEQIAESVTLHRQVEHSFSQEIRFDLTSETTIKGSYSGVELEQKVTAAFGTTFDQSQTEAEARDVVQQVQHTLTVPAGERVQVVFDKQRVVTETPFTVQGVLDFALWLNFEDWASEKLQQGSLLFRGWHCGKKEFRFASLLEFERFLHGYDVEHPQLAAYPTHCSPDAKAAMAWLFEPTHRTIAASGVKRREIDNNVTIETKVLA